MLPVLLALLVACTSGGEEPVTGGATTAEASAPDGGEPPTGGGDLTIALGGDEGTLTAFTYVTGYPGFNLLGLIYDSLLVLDLENQPQPQLAAEVESSDGDQTWTVRLREGVQWHDGEPFTSADVAFTFAYVQDNPVVSRFASAAGTVEAVDTPDDTTVVLRLAQPDPAFATDALGPLVDLPMLPEHVWREVEDPAAATQDQAIGTGPYRLVEYVPDQRYRLEANADYALGAPALERLTLPVIPEPQTAFAALRTGEIDATAISLDPQATAEFESSDELEVVSGPGFGSILLQLNDGEPPFDEPALRQAVSLAIDVEGLVETALLGAGVPGNPGFLHPESPVGLEPLTHEHDPGRAVELLDGLGYSPGPDGVRERDGTPLRFSLLAGANDPTRIRSAELIAEQLAEVGIEVTVETLEDETLDERVWPGFDVANGRDFQMSMWGWSATNMLSGRRLGQLVHSDPERGIFNIGGINDPGLDALVDKVDAAADLDERRQRLQALHDAIGEQVPFVTLFYDDLVFAYRPEAYDGWRFQAGQGILNRLSLAALE
jgi:peptide/nickel transport system substrate-binding protein